MPAIRSKRQTLVCRYLSYAYPGGHQLKLPMVHLRVSNGDLSLRTTGLIDSGATSTFIPMWISESLNLTVEKTSTAIGAGGTLPIQICRVDLQLLKGMRPVCSMPAAYVMVPLNQDAIPYAVLGRDLLFNQYKITFEERKLKTVLRSY